MITKEDYFRGKEHSFDHDFNAGKLLIKVNKLCDYAAADGCYKYEVDPDTGTQISGSKGGSGDGGYRLPESKTGASSSTHKTGEGVDPADSKRIFAQWCILNQHRLDELGLYMEDPRWTPVWCHFQTKPPRSGKRVYIPAATPPLAPALEGQKPLPFIVK